MLTRAQTAFNESADLEAAAPAPSTLLVISHDVVGRRMAGPGIRYWELAHVLARHLPVVLAVPGETDLASEALAIESYHPENAESVRLLEKRAGMVLASVDAIRRFPFLAAADKPLVVDLYTPFVLENLEIHRAETMPRRDRIHGADLEMLNGLIRRGDFFLCASERQRDLWLGALVAGNRVNPFTYERDPTLRRLIDVVPFGVPSRPAEWKRPAAKGVIGGIGPEDKLVLWGGGLWNWLDPLTPIRAMAAVVREEPRARLLFLAGRHPNPVVPAMSMAGRAEALARELGLLDRAVFFHREWVPYEERAGYLLEASAAVSAHHDHVETRFSFRTRLLDCIWAGLPMVVTEGDLIADRVAAHRLGSVVAPGDSRRMAECLLRILRSEDPRAEHREGFEALRAALTWERVAAPLVRFCREPYQAVDRMGRVLMREEEPTALRRLPARALEIVRERGLRGFLQRAVQHVRWRLTR